MTVHTFIYERYWPMMAQGLSPAWQARTRDLLSLISHGIGHFEVESVPVEAVERMWKGLLATFKTPVTPNKVITRGKHIFKTAQRWKLCSENPFEHIRKQKEPQREFKPLTDAQHEALIHAACPSLKPYLVFARYTGARRSSLARLEERDIDLGRGLMTFRETKNGEDYTIPIHPKLLPWLKLEGQPQRRVLPVYADQHTISQLFRRLTRKVGVTGFRFHDYRHNVGTQLAANGHNVKVIMSALGHKDMRMSIRYTHISQQVLANAFTTSL